MPISKTTYQQEDFDAAICCLRDGGLILYPTDTIWGIGCDATNPQAIERIYQLKQRAETKSMLVLVDSLDALEKIVVEVPEVAYDLVEVSIRPMTIIYDQAKGVAPNLLAEDGSLGIRVTTEAFSRDLCRALGKPVVSTSANVSGTPAPKSFSEIDPIIRQGVDYIVKYRQTDQSETPPSQIIKLGSGGLIQIIRP